MPTANPESGPDAEAASLSGPGSDVAATARAGHPHLSPRRVAVAAAFTLIAVLTGAALIALALTQERPQWWARVDPSDPSTIATAEAVENGIATAMTQVRRPVTEDSESATWKVFITSDQANAWMNVRMKRWLEDQVESGNIALRWPPEIAEIQIRFEGPPRAGVDDGRGRILIGAMVERSPGGSESVRPQTLSASLRPEFRADGSLWVTAETVSIGRLSLPAGWVLPDSSPEAPPEAIPEELAALPQTARVLEAFLGEHPVLSRPVIKLADGRRVRLVNIRPEDDGASGRLVITCRTEDRRE